MALYDPSIIKTGIERHQNAENNSKKLPVPLEVNFGGRNLKITDYNELFDLNKINGNSRRITTLTIKTVSTYKQKLDRSLSSEQLVNNKQLNQLNSNKLTNLESNHPNANHSREESNKDLQFGCESASVKLKNSLSSNNDKENFLNQATRSDFVNSRNDDLEKRRIKEYKIEKSIEIEPKIKVNDDQQLNNFKKYNDNQTDDNFFRNTKKSSSLRQINVKPADTDLSRSKNSYLVSDNFDNLNKLSNFNSHQSLPPRSQQSNKQTTMSNRTKEQFTELKSDQKGKFYFNGTNQNKVNLNDDVDNLSSNLNGQKLSAINDKQERNRFKEHLNASLNSSFNSNHNFGLNKQKDGNNNRNYTGSNSMKPHQPQINTNHFNSQTNPPQSHFQLQNLQQQKQLNQLNQFNNESYLEQYHQNQANTNTSSIRKQYRKLSAGGSNLDEINCDEFVSELKTKIASNNQTTSSPATIAKLNNFQQSNSLGAKNERSNRHLILDTSTMPHLNKRTNQQNLVNNTTLLNSPSSNTLPSSTKKSSSSYLTSTVRRNESFQKATEHHRIRMEPRMRSIRSNKDLQPELPNNKQPTIHNNPNVSEPDSQQQLNAANFNQKRFSYLGSQAANGYQPENENVANETCTTDDWNTTLDTNAETRSSDDRSSRQIKKCDKYGFFIEDDQQPQKQQLKSGRTGSIRKEDEQAKK